jgi:hypothetical protein
LNIAKILKTLWSSKDKEIAELSNELILKWRKITKIENPINSNNKIDSTNINQSSIIESKTNLEEVKFN